MNELKPSLVDVPVRVIIWIRPDCQRAQFEVIKQARPSILFLQSDGGRNPKEWETIYQNRKIFDEEIDWQCQVYKIYEKTNQGLYTMAQKVSSLIWGLVDRCIFLEDDHIPAVSFFRFCSELLEKYKDDPRIEMITGNNVFTTYPSAENYDYFFSETGWSIWGIATWRDRYLNRTFPLPYSTNKYIQNCLKDNLSAFWFHKVKGYSQGKMVDGHRPAGEYHHAVNSVLYHRLSIIPTKNMINNIGTTGAHAHVGKHDSDAQFYNLPTFEIEFPIRHPEYVIDDKEFGRMYSNKLGHSQTETQLFITRAKQLFKLLLQGKLIENLMRKMSNRKIEN